MKIQSRKIFTQRENYEQILSKTEEMLLKVSYSLRIGKKTSINLMNPSNSMNEIAIVFYPLQCHQDYCHAYDVHQAAVASSNQSATNMAASSGQNQGIKYK